MAQAADDYVLTMRVMGERIGRPFEAAFGGGVIALGGADFQRLLGERLVACAPDARLAPIALPPERGALVLAAHGCGADPSDLFAKLAALEPAS